jgi:hypothetical protein
MSTFFFLSQEPVTKKPAGAAKNGTLAAPAKKGVPAAKLPAKESSDDDSGSDESSDDVSSALRILILFVLSCYIDNST